jgi:hypothetical protein
MKPASKALYNHLGQGVYKRETTPSLSVNQLPCSGVGQNFANHRNNNNYKGLFPSRTLRVISPLLLLGLRIIIRVSVFSGRKLQGPTLIGANPKA